MSRKAIKIDSIIKMRPRGGVNGGGDRIDGEVLDKAREAGLLHHPNARWPRLKEPGETGSWTVPYKKDNQGNHSGGMTNAGAKSFRHNHIRTRRNESQSVARRFFNRQERRIAKAACRNGGDDYTSLIP